MFEKILFFKLGVCIFHISYQGLECIILTSLENVFMLFFLSQRSEQLNQVLACSILPVCGIHERAIKGYSFNIKNCSTRCGNYHDKNRTVAKQHLLHREGFQNKEMILATLPPVELWDMKGPWTIISHAVISIPCRRYYCRPIISYTSRGNVIKYTWNITAFIGYHFQRMSILVCTSSINVRQNWLR